MAQESSGSQAVTLTLDQLRELISAGKTTTEDQIALMEKQAELTAKAHQKLSRPENVTHPGVSVFSRPGGEVANPKGPLPFKRALWGGTQEALELLTAEEHDLYAQIQPGQYRINRPDGSTFTIEVVAQRNEVSGLIDLLDVRFPTRGKLKDGLPSKSDMLRQMLAQSPRSAASLAS